MEQEPPDNEIVADDGQLAEEPVFKLDRQEAPAGDHLDASGAEYKPLIEEGWPDDPVFDETNIDIVDPYTASPAPAFPESSTPIGQSIPESTEVWNDRQTENPFIPIPYVPATQNETIRRSGLAWSAGIAFFGSVVFTLFLGWIADLLLGTSPWGIVGGIILGSIIAFLQFFRITSKIFPRKDDGPKISPLMSRNDDE